MPDFISRRKFIGTAALSISSAAVSAKDGTHLAGRAERLASYKQGYNYLKEIIKKKSLGYWD